MIRSVALLALTPTLIFSGCILPYAILPIRADLGGARTVRGADGNVLHFAIGAHTASAGPSMVSWSDKVDVGIGYVSDVGAAGQRDHGVYGEGSWFVSRGPYDRLSVGGRGELLLSNNNAGGGLFGRIAGEFFTTGSGSGSADGNCGSTAFAWGGVPAIGLYTEAGGQLLPDGRVAVVSTAGLTFRVPGILGLAIIIPGCH